MFSKKLLCSVKLFFVLEKIVVFLERLFCSAKDCSVLLIVFCSRKDCCVLEKIVVFSERLLCSAKDCCVLKKIIVFLNWNCVVFCPYGPPYPLGQERQPRHWDHPTLIE